MPTNATMVDSDGAWTLQLKNTAIEGRLALGAFLGQVNTQDSNTTPLTQWRTGVIPTTSFNGTVFDLLCSFSSGLNYTVYPGYSVINRSGQGPYLCYNSTPKTVTFDPGDASNTRRDIIYAQVLDTNIGDGSTNYQIGIQAGTPGSSSDPTLPTGAFALKRVIVPVNASNLSGATTADLRKATNSPYGVRVLLPGDTTSTTTDGYLQGELRYRAGSGGIPDLVEYWGDDGKWHSLANEDKICQVQWSGGTFTNVGGQNLFAQGGWAATADPYGMFHSAPGAGTYSYIQIPEDGRYDFEFVVSMSNSTAGSAIACGITKNAADINSSIARDNRAAVTQGGDGTWARAHDIQRLNANDKLYWHTWTYTTADVRNSIFGGAVTHITVRKLND